jgi:hypothetical protein
MTDHRAVISRLPTTTFGHQAHLRQASTPGEKTVCVTRTSESVTTPFGHSLR